MEMDFVATAKKILANSGKPVPTDETALLMAAYEQVKDADFILAHSVRLNKERVNFTKEDWQQILQMSGVEQVEGNMAAFVACVHYGLL